MNTKEIEQKIQRRFSERESILRQYVLEKETFKKTKRQITYTEEARTIAQNIATEIERNSHSKISGVVSLCLSEIFGEDYKFQLEFTRKRNRTQAELHLIKNGNSVGDVLEGDSGGVLDVAGFALRLSSIMLSKPIKRKLLVMDEGFKFVSVEYHPKIRLLLEKLAEEFHVQIIFVTHTQNLQSGYVISL